MESQIELIYEDIRGKDKAKLIKFIGDLDATNVETVLEKICNLFNEGIYTVVADFKKLRYVNSTGSNLLHFSKRPERGMF